MLWAGRPGRGGAGHGTDQRGPWTLCAAQPLCRSLPLPPLYQVPAPRLLGRGEWWSLPPRLQGETHMSCSAGPPPGLGQRWASVPVSARLRGPAHGVRAARPGLGADSPSVQRGRGAGGSTSSVSTHRSEPLSRPAPLPHRSALGSVGRRGSRGCPEATEAADAQAPGSPRPRSARTCGQTCLARPAHVPGPRGSPSPSAFSALRELPAEPLTDGEPRWVPSRC